MKTVILAGGLGTRLSEVTSEIPKPMVPIRGRPILWHIMKLYADQGFRDFVIALGYKGEVIKRYFLDYFHLSNSFIIDVAQNQVEILDQRADDWRVQLQDTGLHTQTGGRLRRLAPFLSDGTFMATYGDGVASVDIQALVDFHESHGRLATVTAVRPPARFGGLIFDGDRVAEFTEKPQVGEGWINGGFFVLEPGILEYVDADDMPFERDPLERLAADGELMAFRHEGFWQCMDTQRDVRLLEELGGQDPPPWRHPEAGGSDDA